MLYIRGEPEQPPPYEKWFMSKTDAIRNRDDHHTCYPLYNLWNMVPLFIIKQTQAETVNFIMCPTVLLENGSWFIIKLETETIGLLENVSMVKTANTNHAAKLKANERYERNRLANPHTVCLKATENELSMLRACKMQRE